MTGILKVENGDSRINGVLLARSGSGDPFGNATNFLSDNDCEDGDCVTVTGTQRTNGFFIDSAVKESPSKCAAAEVVAEGGPEAEFEEAEPVTELAEASPAKPRPTAKKAKKQTGRKGAKKEKRAAQKKIKRQPTKTARKTSRKGTTKQAKRRRSR